MESVGVFWIDCDDQRIFGNLKLSIPGFFLGGGGVGGGGRKIWKVLYFEVA